MLSYSTTVDMWKRLQLLQLTVSSLEFLKSVCYMEPMNTETGNSKYSPNIFVQLLLRAMGCGVLGDRKKILLYKKSGWGNHNTVYRKVLLLKLCIL